LGKVEKLIIVYLTAILIFSTNFSHDSIFAQTQGPRTEDLIIKFYPNIEQAYAALKNGSIDICAYELTSDLYQDAIDDSNIVLAPVGDRGMYEFDINNNYTCADYPDIESPTHRLEMRQAIAYLTPKDRIVSEFCGGFANRIDQPLAYVLRGWRNQSYWYEDGSYPYEYDPLAAAAVLDSGGFPQGTTPNPDYDPSYLGSSEYIRTYPPDHPQKPEQDLDPLEFLARSDDSRRLQAGRLLDENLRKLGIPANFVDYWWWWPSPFDEGRYHIYTGGWSVGRFPGITAYGLYHHNNYFVGGSNYVTGVDQNGDPNYPKLNELLEAARYPDNHTEAVSAIKNALGYFTEECITIPLFSARSYWAWSTSLLGVVNSDGIGPVNDYTFLNAYKVDGSPIRVGLKMPPNQMNKIYSQWYYDYQCLDRMELYENIETPPYDQSVGQVSYLKSWETSTWDDDGVDKTMVRKWLRNDSYFVEPVTGNQKANFNTSHYFFSVWYTYQAPSSWWCSLQNPLHHIDIVNEYQVDVYFDSLSYWNLYETTGPILPIDLWLQQTELSTQHTEIFIEGANLTTPGIVELNDNPMWIADVTVNDEPLHMFNDYNIIGQGSCESGQLEIFTDLSNDSMVSIRYWGVDDPQGYTPGELPWQTIFEGAGMYYATDFVSGAGGYITLKRNPFYPTETPPIGEVDFIKKANGCYKVDIFDVVMAATAYGSQGVEKPDAHWFAGADLAYPGGQIEIFDIVTVTINYGTEWDCYP